MFELRNIKNPYIKVSIIPNKDSLKLKFQDNAQGVKDDIKKIFDKNYSMSSSSGIGLYLAKKIVEYKLNGDISATNKNNGICFYISLFYKEARL